MSNKEFTRRSLLAGSAAVATQLGTVSRGETTSDPLAWTLNEAAAALERRVISSEELTKLCLARIDKLDRILNSFITLDADSALRRARECDRQRRAGRISSRLHGIPLALKDNFDTAGLRTTAAAEVFRDRVPAEDAEVTRRLKTAGAILLGKLNLDEMAFAGTGTTGCFGPRTQPMESGQNHRRFVGRVRRRSFRRTLLQKE